jgi:hypothetical protein
MFMPSPKNVLRIMVNVCLMGAGVSAIAQARHVGAPGFGPLAWLRDLTLFFFFSLLAFALFFAEYQIFQGLTRRDLNVSLGIPAGAGLHTAGDVRPVGNLLFDLAATAGRPLQRRLPGSHPADPLHIWARGLRDERSQQLSP